VIRQPVDSSNLRSVGYDPTEELLEIEFQHGGVYLYSRVPKETYEGLMQASSHGRYFRDWILDMFPYRKLRR
jgi:KTSC domain